MPVQNTEAVVLKSIKQGETSKILTLFSRSFGKIKVIAKGARGARSRFGGILELANHIAVVFYEKENRDLQFLSQADLIKPFMQRRNDIENTAYAMAVCELTDKLEVDRQPNFPLFRVLVQALQGLQMSEDAANVFRAFQIRICGLHGFQPNLDICMQCRNRPVRDVFFITEEGGFVCDTCQRMASTGIHLTHESVTALKKLQSGSLAHLNGLLPSNLAQQQVDAFLDIYLKYHVDGLRSLKSLEFLRKIRRYS